MTDYGQLTVTGPSSWLDFDKTKQAHSRTSSDSSSCFKSILELTQPRLSFNSRHRIALRRCPSSAASETRSRPFWTASRRQSQRRYLRLRLTRSVVCCADRSRTLFRHHCCVVSTAFVIAGRISNVRLSCCSSTTHYCQRVCNCRLQ